MEKITFEDIKKANESIVTLDIKGKEYAQVNERIKAFRMVYPDGIIETEMLSNENGVCIFKATAGYRDDMGNIMVLATGTAYEKENSTFINKTSYIENAETSSIGRCLGIAGFGIDTSVCSAEEVQNAINNQNKDEDERIELVKRFNELLIKTETDADAIYEHYKVENSSKMSNDQYKDAIKIMEKKGK